MKKYTLLLLCCLFLSIMVKAQQEEKEIRNILLQQTVAWNKGDIASFMKGYWNNDSLMFIGKSGVTYGYGNTLRNYQKNYSDADKMGKLSFDILHVKKISPAYYFVIGKWFLKRNAGDVSGHYTLLFQKISGAWQIICDHSS